LICAQEASWQLQLDEVVLMPVGEAPHRELEQDPGPEARYELCRLAVAGDERLSVSRLEIEKPGRSYTVETLRALREETPDAELLFIMGADEAASLPSWKDPEEVLRLASIAVAERESAGRDRVCEVVEALGAGDRVKFFSMPGIAISSTMIRERIASDRPIRYLVPQAVADYIERAGLYRAGGAT
jgi:nicotinate-nucleotide adenylyltransferase